MSGKAAHMSFMDKTPRQQTPIAVRRDAVVTWIDADGNPQRARADKGLLHKKLYSAKMIRTGNRYPKQRNYHGLNWFANTQTHVWCESLFERHALLWLDFTCDIVKIAAQPMKISFGDGTHHTPDFMTRHADGRQVLYDVKPTRYLTGKALVQFEKTAEICKKIGWGYEVLSDLDPQVHINLDFLASFRHPAFAPPAEERTRLLASMHGPMPLGELGPILQMPAGEARSSVYHLLWRRDLYLDLTQLMSSKTLTAKEPHAHA